MTDDAAVHPLRFLACACAAALAHVDNGKSALLVSTDPASNLDEILDVPLGNLAVAVSGAERLQVLNIDATAAAESYRLRVMAQMGLDASAQELDTVREHYTHVLLVSLAETTPVSQASSFAGGPAARAYRALRLGHQQEPARRWNPRLAASAAIAG